VLGRCGATTLLAASVAEAIAAVDAAPPDIIVSDIAMPEADGYDLIRYVRETRRLRTPVVAMTAFSRNGDQERMLAAGFDSYLKKPVEPVELAREVHAVLQRVRPAEQ
jgi:CheY-like chemotaxis protein